MFTITRGLDVPIEGQPRQEVEDGQPIKRVALLGADYVGMKPTMAVRVGDRVKLGQLLFTDKLNQRVEYRSPACGRVAEVNRGAKRVFQSVVVEIEGDDEETFPSSTENELSTLTRATVVERLLQSALWTSLRTRPYSKVPDPDSTPSAIFVTAIDTNPLAADPSVVIAERPADLRNGLQVLSHLTDGPLYLCQSPDAELPGAELDVVKVSEFAGPHPAGLAGTHIHFLDPVGPNKTVWTIGYQDVMAVGSLFVTGRLSVDRVVSLAGPSVTTPRLVRTRLGASTDEIVAGQLNAGDHRTISGSVLSGRTAQEASAFLGRYHYQVSVLPEGGQRKFLGWQRPGFDKFSVTRAFASAFKRDSQSFPMTTSLEGSRRAMVPIGSYERVMPLDIEPTFLLRALIVGDTVEAQELGCLELDEEDVALCTFVCPGKYEYGPLLRQRLVEIEIDG